MPIRPSDIKGNPKVPAVNTAKNFVNESKDLELIIPNISPNAVTNSAIARDTPTIASVITPNVFIAGRAITPKLPALVAMVISERVTA